MGIHLSNSKWPTTLKPNLLKPQSLGKLPKLLKRPKKKLTESTKKTARTETPKTATKTAIPKMAIAKMAILKMATAKMAIAKTDTKPRKMARPKPKTERKIPTARRLRPKMVTPTKRPPNVKPK